MALSAVVRSVGVVLYFEDLRCLASQFGLSTCLFTVNFKVIGYVYDRNRDVRCWSQKHVRTKEVAVPAFIGVTPAACGARRLQ